MGHINRSVSLGEGRHFGFPFPSRSGGSREIWSAGTPEFRILLGWCDTFPKENHRPPLNESDPPGAPSRQHSRDNEGFPGGAVVENLPANAGDTGSSPGLGRSHMPRSN